MITAIDCVRIDNTSLLFNFQNIYIHKSKSVILIHSKFGSFDRSYL